VAAADWPWLLPSAAGWPCGYHLAAWLLLTGRSCCRLGQPSRLKSYGAARARPTARNGHAHSYIPAAKSRRFALVFQKIALRFAIPLHICTNELRPNGHIY
jgi:hypothetical protein